MEHASSFKNKVALVVGGASGMGKAVAHMLTDAGCKTHIFDIKDAANGDFQHCDIRDHSQVHRCIADLVAHEGRIDLLFIAAGVHLAANIEDTTLEQFERLMAVNVNGTFYVLKEVLPVMRKQQYGNIVLMGSDQVFIGKGASAAYGMSKAAIGQLTKSTAIDYAPYNIRVNCICPGTINTPMFAAAVQNFHQVSGLPVDEIYDAMRKAQPIQRLGTPEEIGKAVMFLLSDDCRYMTGALLSVDGAYTCQ